MVLHLEVFANSKQRLIQLWVSGSNGKIASFNNKDIFENAKIVKSNINMEKDKKAIDN